MYVASEARFAGLIAVSDALKDSTADVIEQLKKLGIRVVTVTGDNHTTAASLAQNWGSTSKPTCCRKRKPRS